MRTVAAASLSWTTSHDVVVKARAVQVSDIARSKGLPRNTQRPALSEIWIGAAGQYRIGAHTDVSLLMSYGYTTLFSFEAESVC